jgi:hypothetical protein
LLREALDNSGVRHAVEPDGRQGSQANGEEEIRLRRLEELRIRRREALDGPSDEEYLAGDDKSGDRKQKSWPRLFKRGRSDQ